MNDSERSLAVDTLTRRILSTAQRLGGIKQVVVVPHSVEGHFICQVQLEPGSDRRAFKKLFNGTAVGNSVYFTENLRPR